MSFEDPLFRKTAVPDEDLVQLVQYILLCRLDVANKLSEICMDDFRVVDSLEDTDIPMQTLKKIGSKDTNRATPLVYILRQFDNMLAHVYTICQQEIQTYLSRVDGVDASDAPESDATKNNGAGAKRKSEEKDLGEPRDVFVQTIKQLWKQAVAMREKANLSTDGDQHDVDEDDDDEEEEEDASDHDDFIVPDGTERPNTRHRARNRTFGDDTNEVVDNDEKDGDWEDNGEGAEDSSGSGSEATDGSKDDDDAQNEKSEKDDDESGGDEDEQRARTSSGTGTPAKKKKSE